VPIFNAALRATRHSRVNADIGINPCNHRSRAPRSCARGGPRVHDRDNPVFCDLSGDTQDLVVALFQVLADDSREQAGCLGDNIGEFTAFERQEAGIGVLRASVDETLARWGVLQSI